MAIIKLFVAALLLLASSLTLSTVQCVYVEGMGKPHEKNEKLPRTEEQIRLAKDAAQMEKLHFEQPKEVAFSPEAVLEMKHKREISEISQWNSGRDHFMDNPHAAQYKRSSLDFKPFAELMAATKDAPLTPHQTELVAEMKSANDDHKYTQVSIERTLNPELPRQIADVYLTSVKEFKTPQFVDGLGNNWPEALNMVKILESRYRDETIKTKDWSRETFDRLSTEQLGEKIKQFIENKRGKDKANMAANEKQMAKLMKEWEQLKHVEPASEMSPIRKQAISEVVEWNNRLGTEYAAKPYKPSVLDDKNFHDFMKKTNGGEGFDKEQQVEVQTLKTLNAREMYAQAQNERMNSPTLPLEMAEALIKNEYNPKFVDALGNDWPQAKQIMIHMMDQYTVRTRKDFFKLDKVSMAEQIKTFLLTRKWENQQQIESHQKTIAEKTKQLLQKVNNGAHFDDAASEEEMDQRMKKRKTHRAKKLRVRVQVDVE